MSLSYVVLRRQGQTEAPPFEVTYSSCPNMKWTLGQSNSTHITLALLCRGLWHLRPDEEPYFSRARSLVSPSRRRDRSLAPDSPELYLTKEALESRLLGRLHDNYWGPAFKRFVEIARHSG